MDPAIKISKLVKSYGEVEALKGISFEVSEGELFGLIGPDGSGKTTLFRILVSLLLPGTGKASMLNYDVEKDYRKIRRITGYMPERFSLYQDLSVEENLKFFAGIFKASIEENYYLIEDIFKMLEPFRKRMAGKLSGGMKQKLALSCALIHKPRVLILDEPTTGVDAVSRKEFWGMLKKLKKENITILVSTPYMDEAGMCDRVALMQKGELLGIDTPEGLIKDFRHPLLSVKTNDMYRLLGDLKDYDKCHSAHRFGEYIHLATTGEEPDMDELKEYLKTKGHEKINIGTIDPEVEDCFMELMHEVD